MDRVAWQATVSVQLLSGVQLFATPWTAARHASLSFTISQSLLKLMSIDAIQPSHPLRPLLLLPSANTLHLRGQRLGLLCSEMVTAQR